MIAPSEHFDQPTNSIDGSKALAPAPGIIHDIGDEHCGGDGGEGGRDLVWSWPEVLSPPSGLPISPVGTFCDDSAHYDDDPGFMDIDSNACYNMFNNMNSATLVGEPPDIAADCVRAAAAANDEFDNELGLLSDRDSQSASKATVRVWSQSVLFPCAPIYFLRKKTVERYILFLPVPGDVMAFFMVLTSRVWNYHIGRSNKRIASSRRLHFWNPGHQPIRA